MRFTKKKLDEVILFVLGEEGLPLVEELASKPNVSEFDLSKKIHVDIKIVRKMLYMLYNHNLVSFHRKKDKQKGWYIYYWTLLPENIKFNYYKRQRELLVRLKERLTEEEKELFFCCPQGCVRINFDRSMDFEFHCPECGELLIQDDSEEYKKSLKRRINTIEEELEAIAVKRKIRRTTVKKKKTTILAKKKASRKKTKKTVKKKAAIKKKATKKTTKKKTVKKKAAVKKKTAKKTKKKIVKKVAAKRKAVRKTNKKSTTTKSSGKKVAKKPTKKKAPTKKVTKKKLPSKTTEKKKTEKQKKVTAYDG